jgi:hypothetical protein
MRTALLAALTALLAFPNAARAQEPAPAPEAARFGTSGVLSISSDFQAGIKGQLFSAPSGGDPNGLFSVTLAPALDYFVADHVSLGGQVVLLYARNGGAKLTAFGLGPRIGYEFPLSEKVSLWPKLSIIYATANVDSGVSTLGGSVTFDGWSLAVDVFAPLLFHVVPHFFLGFGPDLSTELVAKASGKDAIKTTSIGGLFTVGGWL